MSASAALLPDRADSRSDRTVRRLVAPDGRA